MTAMLDDATPTPAARALHWLAVAYAAKRQSGGGGHSGFGFILRKDKTVRCTR